MMEEKDIILQSTEYQTLFDNIRDLVDSARSKVVAHVNTIMTETYWRIGEYIVNFEQRGKLRAEYGKKVIQKSRHCLDN
ncbi:MAG: hypothetical protein KBT40_02425 [bacterium]|nr:hypothetical protein [Candidatus Minthenecus merdequi]